MEQKAASVSHTLYTEPIYCLPMGTHICARLCLFVCLFVCASGVSLCLILFCFLFFSFIIWYVRTHAPQVIAFLHTPNGSRILIIVIYHWLFSNHSSRLFSRWIGGINKLNWLLNSGAFMIKYLFNSNSINGEDDEEANIIDRANEILLIQFWANTHAVTHS